MPDTPAHTARPVTPVAEPAQDVLDLSVIIVNYNVREFLEQALESVQRASAGLDVEVMVVDNNSVDGSVAMVRDRFPGVCVIANEENVGFGRANNQAIRRARGRYLLILNPDTIVQEDTFSTLVRFMDEHPEAGAVGCQILNPDGTFAPESRRAFPTPAVAFYRMTGLSRLFPRSRTFGRYNLTYLPRDEVAEVDALSGSCMLVRHAALHHPSPARRAARPSSTGAGLFDEDYFMYGEDLDWCYRIQQAGWKIYYTPATKIIHYKGESTKKGELRYVRLFYGAMLLFAEKHLESDHSRLFTGLLKLAIMARAGLSMLSSAARRLTPLVLDFVLVYSVVTLVGYAYSEYLGASLAPSFLISVAPGYALGTLLGTAVLGGYRRNRRQPPRRSVVLGATLGLLMVAAASFFIKGMAFSRVVVVLSYPLVVAALLTWRYGGRNRHPGPRRALLVGHAAEARRLQALLDAHPQPPFELEGYVDALADAPRLKPAPPRLGTLHHLRDLVRLRRIDDVVFAADGLTNRTIFGLMQKLRDQPVQFRMLAGGRQHLIGKATIDDLSMPALLEAPLKAPRSLAARRAFEVPVAVIGLALHPVIRLLSRRSAFMAALAERTRQCGAVLRGERMLIGYHADDPFCPPEEWNLGPGVFAVTDTLGTPEPTREACSHAYWYYISHQSAAADWDVMVRALRNMRT